MSKNSANRNFYYENSVSGSYVFSLKVAYRPEGESCGSDWSTKGWAPLWSAVQSYTIGTVENNTTNNSDSGSTNSENQTQTNSGSSNVSTFPVDPKVFAEIKLSSKTLITGAQFFIGGEGYGLEKKPLSNARFVWNFGDGTVAQGRSVAYTYRNPGEYVIVLDISSGKFSGTAREVVSVIESPLDIRVEKVGFDGSVTIKNNSNFEFDLSGWFIESGDYKFIIPLHTILLPQKSLSFHGEVVGLPVLQHVSLLYPNGRIASTGFLKQAVVQASNKVAFVPQASSVVQKPVHIEIPNQTASAISAVNESDEVLYEDSEQKGSKWLWIGAFVLLLGIATSSVFLIKRPVYNQADDFTIEEQ